MPQRILEPGEIETLASRDVPRIILPERDSLFANRARRLRALAGTNAIGGYLQLMAALVEGQQALLDALMPAELAELQALAFAQAPAAAVAAGMPRLHASSLARDGEWRAMLRALCRHCTATHGLPRQARDALQALDAASDAWLEAQADALLEVPGTGAVDPVAAPFVMAALQVYWVALALAFKPEDLRPMADAPGLCPSCGTPPVASVVHARAPHASYRYLACALCACQWHFVRVQCSQCGASGKDIAYRVLTGAEEDEAVAREAALRAETCDHCHSYRKILYLEKDPAAEPVADDLGTMALDLLLGEAGYARASQNPLLWQAAGD